jgi:hypothetical protein
VRVSTSEGREGRFIVWRGRKGRGEEKDITAMKEKQSCGNGNRTYCKTNKGLVYESVSPVSVPVQVGNDATARYGIRQGQKKELAKKINYQRKWF